MVRKLIFSLSVLITIGAGVWIYKAPGEVEPIITFIGSLIGVLSTLPFNKESKSDLKEKDVDEAKKVETIETEGLAQQAAEISPPVFVSYAHDNELHKEHTLELADKLNGLGVDCWIDRYVEDNPPARGWPLWMEERIRLSSFILVVASDRYLARFEGREDELRGKGAKFESVLLVQSVYDNDSLNQRIIPIYFDDDDLKFIPSVFRATTSYKVSDEKQFDKLYRRLTNQPEISKPKLGKRKKFGRKSSDPVERKNPVVQTLAGTPAFDEFTKNMKQAHKIMQTYLGLPLTRRFEIARQLDLLESSESFNSPNADQITATVLVRAKQKNQLGKLWSILFDESIDPNPFN